MNKLRFAWFVSLVATMGSLYFSEVKHFIPCELCWYQRILMYPLVVVLGIAVFRRDVQVKKYVLPLSILGFAVGTYHYVLQKTTLFQKSFECTGVSCSAQYINWAGFITIPLLSLVAFLLISVSLLLIKNNKKEKNGEA